MIIPKKIKIGGHWFKITKETGSGNMGWCDSEKNVINIGPKAPQSQQEATLIHEIFHALNTTFSGGHNFSHALLDSLSEQFYQVLSDNKLLNPITEKKSKKKTKKRK